MAATITARGEAAEGLLRVISGPLLRTDPNAGYRFAHPVKSSFCLGGCCAC